MPKYKAYTYADLVRYHFRHGDFPADADPKEVESFKRVSENSAYGKSDGSIKARSIPGVSHHSAGRIGRVLPHRSGRG